MGSATMRAAFVEAPGPAESIRVVPLPGPGDVLVRVEAGGVPGRLLLRP